MQNLRSLQPQQDEERAKRLLQLRVLKSKVQTSAFFPSLLRVRLRALRWSYHPKVRILGRATEGYLFSEFPKSGTPIFTVGHVRRLYVRIFAGQSPL